MKLPPCTPRRRRSSRPDRVAVFWFFLVQTAACFLFPVISCLAGGPAEVPTYSLEDCLALVRKQNPEVLAAAKRVDAVRAAITTAKGPLYPSLTSSGYYQYREQSLTSAGGTNPNIRKDDYFADARLSQNVFSSGAVRNRIAAAKIQLEAEINTYRAQIDTSTLAARIAFYQTLYAESSIGIRQQAVDLLSAQVKDQTDRLAAGSVGQLNVNRAQVSLANEEPALLEARSSVQTAYVSLAQLLGVAYPADARTRPFRVRGELSCPPARLTLAECVARAQANRPEIAARQLAVEAFKHQIIVEQAGTRPQVSAYAAYDVYSEPSLLSVRDSFSGYVVGVQATWNVFDGFATRGRVRGVRAQQGQAEALLEGTKQQVEAEIRAAFYDLQQARETLQPLGKNISLADETQALSAKLFDAGGSTQLDVLQTRVELTRARLSELTVRLRYHTALARLERAMGMGRQTGGNATDLKPAKK